MKQIHATIFGAIIVFKSMPAIAVGLACPEPSYVPCTGNPNMARRCGTAYCDTSGVDWFSCMSTILYMGSCASASWANVSGQNYQCYYSCDCDRCTTYYRCVAGYYGSQTSCTGSGNCAPTCASCATATGYIAATSVLGDNSTIQRCYLPTGTYSDVAGNFDYTSVCYYIN